MHTPDALRRHLDTLTQALDIPGADLQAMLEVLVDDLTTAVSSFLGLRITISAGEVSTTLDTFDGHLGPTPRASLLLPLHLITGAAPADTMILYAAEPHAFTDLATATREAFNLDGQVLIDQHLLTTHDPANLRGVGAEDASMINIAIGILIDQGYPPEHAHQELARRATHHDNDLAAAAGDVLNSLSSENGGPDGGDNAWRI